MVERLYEFMMSKVFPDALEDPAALMESVAAFEGMMEFRSGELHFTLPALFDFLTEQIPDWPVKDKSERRRDYLRFRKTIFKNPTNDTLRRRDATVEIAFLSVEQDDIVYRLVKMATSR